MIRLVAYETAGRDPFVPRCTATKGHPVERGREKLMMMQSISRWNTCVRNDDDGDGDGDDDDDQLGG